MRLQIQRRDMVAFDYNMPIRTKGYVMRLGSSQTRPQWLQVGLGLAITVATYLYLVLTRPAGLSESIANNSAALLALAGYLVGAGLIVWGVARQFSTSTYALIPVEVEN